MQSRPCAQRKRASVEEPADGYVACNRGRSPLTENAVPPRTYRQSRPMKPPMTLVSLFAGAGGLDAGLEQAGFETRLAIDNDADAMATLKATQAATHSAWPRSRVPGGATARIWSSQRRPSFREPPTTQW